MYRQKVEAFGRYEKHTFYNKDSGNSFSIVPEVGAVMLDLVFKNTNILDGYSNPSDLETLPMSKNVVLYPFPNRLKSGKYTFNGKKYSFPINNAATKNAIHGFGKDFPMTVDRVITTNTYSEVICSAKHDGTNRSYPFKFKFQVSFTINDINQLDVEMKFINLDKEPIPAGIGWHPYFKLAEVVDDLKLRMPICNKVEVDEFMIPTGKKEKYYRFQQRANPINTSKLDTCFEIVPDKGRQTKVRLIAEDATLDYWQYIGLGKFNFLQMFIPPHRKSIAIEPMTCNIDAFNNGDGLITLAPNEQISAKFGVVYTKR